MKQVHQSKARYQHVLCADLCPEYECICNISCENLEKIEQKVIPDDELSNVEFNVHLY